MIFEIIAFPQFNRQLQADPNHPWQGVLQQSGPGQPRHSEQASGFEGGDTSQDQGSLRLQELEERVCHHGEAEPPHHCLLTRGRLCHLLLLMSGPRLRPLEAISATHLEARGSSASSCTRSRCLFNCDHHFCDDDGNDEMSMNMIVTTKEVFQLKKYVQKRKNNVCSGLLLNEESSSSPPPCTRSRFRGSGICPVQLQWWGRSITMMM